MTKSDYARWSLSASLKSDWDERTFLLADMIPDTATTIIEFGAANMVIKDRLLPHQEYTPSDLVDRGPGTIVYDLNQLPYSFIENKYDVAFFSGVLEYVHNVPELVRYVSTFSDIVICSYAHQPINPARRINSKWVNSYSKNKLLEIFKDNGFKNDSYGTWSSGRQGLYRFIKA